MPIKCNQLKALYICKCFEDINRKAEENQTNLNNSSNVKNCIDLANRLHDEGKVAHLGGDEERSYILFYRFFQMIKSIKSLNAYKNDDKYYSSLMGLNRLPEVLKTLEALSQSLQNRYSALEESQRLRAKEISESALVSNNLNTNDSKPVSTDYKTIESNESTYPLIDCQTLIESLENTTDMNKVLIFDTRSDEDYKLSHISNIKTTADITVAHVSQPLLTPGLTASKLEALLPYGHIKDAFDRRRRMNKVVIVDQCSTELITGSPAFNLAEALWKWDYTSLKVKMKPFFLRGGYEEWVITYPMFTTNPNAVFDSKTSFTRKQINLSFNYDFNEESENTDKKSDNHLSNGLENGDISEVTQKAPTDTEQTSNINNIFHPRPTNAAIPGTALPLIPDRSTKPQTLNTIPKPTEITERTDSFENFKLKKLNQISEEMMSNMREEYHKEIHSLKIDLKTKEEENSHLKTTVRKLLPEKPTNISTNQIIDNKDDKPMVVITNEDINTSDKRNGFYISQSGDEDKENNDFVVRNSESINSDIESQTPNRNISSTKSIIKSNNSLTVGSNLSRSLSSPNIAQLMAKEMGRQPEDMNFIEAKERSFTNPSMPAFDRTLKPLPNREKYNFHESNIIDNKLRDFCPVHSAGPSITGLRNLGNTCFMNSVIQCLLNTTEFSSFLLTGNYRLNKNSKFGSNGELVLELSALFRAMAYPSSYKSLSPKDFKQAVGKHIQGFIGYAQQDSHEFLVKLLEKLHEDLNESTARDVIDTSALDKLSLSLAATKFWKEHQNKNNSIITKLFEGLIVNTLTCLTCSGSSNTFEVFSCLSLPLSNHRTTLTECLKQYFKAERMSGEAAWMCPTCKQKREADKKVNVWRLPKVLIIHLKRFSYEGVWRQKLQTLVEFPIDDLPMRSLNASETHYNLYGVVNHYGTLEGGHYTAYSHNEGKYKWHRFDDQEISQLNACNVTTQAAYVLFYKCS